MAIENNVKQGMCVRHDPNGVVTHGLDSAAESANRIVDTIADAVHPFVDQLATCARQAVSVADVMAGARSTVLIKGNQMRNTSYVPLRVAGHRSAINQWWLLA